MNGHRRLTPSPAAARTCTRSLSRCARLFDLFLAAREPIMPLYVAAAFLRRNKGAIMRGAEVRGAGGGA